MEQEYSFKQIAMIVCVLIIGLIILYTKYSNWQEEATNPIDPIVGDVTYWTEDAETKARIIQKVKDKILILEGAQGTDPVTGILITTLQFQECGLVQFQRKTLGSPFAYVDVAKFNNNPTCPIKDWGGAWRISQLPTVPLAAKEK